MPDILEMLGFSRLSLNRVARAEQKPALPVLLYNRFHAADVKTAAYSIAEVEQQLDWMHANGYRFLKLQAAVDAMAGERTGEARSVALIVDDADVSTYLLLFPLLRRRRIPLTLLIHPSAVSNSEGALSWAQLGEMVLSGLVDVQYHPETPAEFAHDSKHRSQWQERMELELGVPIEMIVRRRGSRAA